MTMTQNRVRLVAWALPIIMAGATAASAETPPSQAGRVSPPPVKRSLDSALDKPVSLDYNRTPLQQVIDDLRANLGVNIVLDLPALEAEGIDPKEWPITIRLDAVKARTSLELLFHGARLVLVVKDEVIVITTKAGARGKLVYRVYTIDDLVGSEQGNTEEANRDVEKVIREMTNMIEPETWSERGGLGTIEYRSTDQRLVVVQTNDVQEQITELLAALRRIRNWDQENMVPAPVEIVSTGFMPRWQAGLAPIEFVPGSVPRWQVGLNRESRPIQPSLPLLLNYWPSYSGMPFPLAEGVSSTAVSPAQCPQPNSVPAAGVALSVQAENGQCKIALPSEAEMCLYAHRFKLSGPGNGDAEVSAIDKQVKLTCRFFQATADRLLKSGPGDRTVLEGHVSLKYHTGGQAIVNADRVLANLTDGRVELPPCISVDSTMQSEAPMPFDFYFGGVIR
jgi:hypothetical protein